MSYCGHNEDDLLPDIVTLAENGVKSDWIVIRCASCEQIVGGRRSLLDLIDQITTEQES